LTQVLIGTGGWTYFNVPARDRLAAYAKHYGFVEVNSTYYQIPPISAAQSWRNRVPEHFEFSVRCSRSIYENGKLRNIDRNKQLLQQMVDICSILRAKTLHVLTPESCVLDKQELAGMKRLLGSVDPEIVRIAWEIRRKPDSALPVEVLNVIRELQIVHCVDLSKELPRVESNAMYSRLFGKGEQNIYQFDDQELKSIDRKASETRLKMSSLSFHGVKMHSDAMRLAVYRKTGRFPKVTRSVGLESLTEILNEDPVYPASREVLILSHGWKVFDLTTDQRVHAAEYLKLLPNQSYGSTRDVVDFLKRYL